MPPLSWTALRCTQPDHRPRGAMRGRGMPASRTMSQMVSRGLQASFTGLMLLHDQDDKAWCHGGHGRSCSPYVNIVLVTPHASPQLATAASTRGCGGLTLHSAGDQKNLSQGCHLFGGDGRQAGTYTTYRFTDISAPRSSACLSEKFECAEVVQSQRVVASTVYCSSSSWDRGCVLF